MEQANVVIKEEIEEGIGVLPESLMELARFMAAHNLSGKGRQVGELLKLILQKDS